MAYAVTCVRKQLESGNDFPIYHAAARTLFSGGSPYQTETGLHGYVYPPFFALAIAPLAALPLPAAVVVWYAINIGLISVALATVRRLLDEGAPGRIPRWALPASALALGGWFFDNLALGQVNIALLALTLAAALGFTGSRRDIGSGALLGLACAIKMHAALLLLPALVRGRWRAGVGFAAGLAAAVALLPAAILGPGRTVGLMEEWTEKVIAPSQAGTLQGSAIWDQSPQAALRRLTVAEPAFGDVRVNLASLTVAQFRRASGALGAALLALLLAVWIFGPAKGTRQSLLLDLGLAYCGTLLVVGFHLKAHFIALLLPGALVVGGLGATRTERSRGLALLTACAVLLILSNPGIVGRAVSSWALAYSSMTLATLLLTGLLVTRRLSRTGVTR